MKNSELGCVDSHGWFKENHELIVVDSLAWFQRKSRPRAFVFSISENRFAIKKAFRIGGGLGADGPVGARVRARGPRHDPHGNKHTQWVSE